MVLVLGALRREIAPIRQQIEQLQQEDWSGFEFCRGRIGAVETAVGRIGVGKASAAAMTQRLVDRCRPAAVILSGIAGGLSPELEIGDIVVARSCLQYDLDVSAFGYPLGEVPETPSGVFACDPALAEVVAAAPGFRGRARLGRVLTGDRFLDVGEKQRLAAERGVAGDVVDMESAAVALVCRLNGVPLVVVRTVSDTLDGRRARRFGRLVGSCSDSAVRCLQQLSEAGLIP